MVQLKRAADPRGVMNLGVIITDDDREHMKNFKLNPQVEDEIDSCVECGYCEPVCPSRDITMTPRQRIVVRRARAKAIQDGDTELVKHIDEAYQYDGIDTCAVDSMCVTACPVKIDTGKFIKSLRRGQAGAAESAGWTAAAKAWGPGNTLASAALTGAYYMPTKLVQKVTDVARALELLGQTRGRERALETVRGYVDDVERELDALPDGPAREALRTMTRLTVERVG